MNHTQASDPDTRQAQKVVSHYSRLAPAYDRRWDRYSLGSLGKLVERLDLRGSERVLDIACGTGRLEELLREQHPGLDVTGVDLSPDMLTVARERLPEDARTRWLQGTDESVKLPEASFDLVTCNNAFHLFPDQQASLHRMARLVRPGGLVALIDWCREYPQISALQLVTRIGLGQRRRILTRAELSAMMRAAGLEMTHEERFNATPFWGMMCMIARRADEALP
jgi:ubiquinone/menaquinone biosynthesis C-methylase UbiE